MRNTSSPGMNASPYLPYPDDPAVARELVLLKDAADNFECSVDTLKKNAKSGRFPAYQSGFGMPVFVIPSVIGEFLKSRRDVDSIFRKRGGARSADLGTPPPAPLGAGGGTTDTPMSRPPIELGVVQQTSMTNATHDQLALVAACLAEISGILSRTGHAEPLDDLQSQSERP